MRTGRHARRADIADDLALLHADAGGDAVGVTVQLARVPSSVQTVRIALIGDARLSADDLQEAWLRVLVREKPRVGLREDVQEMLPNALEVRIDPDMLPNPSGARMAERAGRSPRQLFADYLDSRGNAEEGVRELFDALYDEVSSNS